MKGIIIRLFNPKLKLQETQLVFFWSALGVDIFYYILTRPIENNTFLTPVLMLKGTAYLHNPIYCQ